jgi:hypothetical protein
MVVYLKLPTESADLIVRDGFPITDPEYFDVFERLMVTGFPPETYFVQRTLLYGGIANILHPSVVIKFYSDLRQVVGFLWVHRFPPPIKLTAMI